MRSSLTHDQQIAAHTEWLARNVVAEVGRKLRPMCETCQAFTASTTNPAGGMGSCKWGHTAVYPGQRRHCADFKRKS